MKSEVASVSTGNHSSSPCPQNVSNLDFQLLEIRDDEFHHLHHHTTFICLLFSLWWCISKEGHKPTSPTASLGAWLSNELCILQAK